MTSHHMKKMLHFRWQLAFKEKIKVYFEENSKATSNNNMTLSSKSNSTFTSPVKHYLQHWKLSFTPNILKFVTQPIFK